MLSHFTCLQLFGTPWTVAHQVPLSMESSGKNTGVGFHALLQGIFPTQGLNLYLSPALTGEYYTTEPPGKATKMCMKTLIFNDQWP